jgi:uncharacterized membrane protein
MRKVYLALFLLSMTNFVACGPSGTGGLSDDSAAPAAITQDDVDNVNFQTVNNKVFRVRCLECHNNGLSTAGVNLEGFSNIRANIGRAEAAISNGRMPPAGRQPLTPNEQVLLGEWIRAGMPQ